MSKKTNTNPLLIMRNVHIRGLSDEVWVDIINGVDLDLKRGEVLGLIGESGAGKSTLGLAAMGFCRDGCKITDGRIEFDGLDLLSQSRQQLRQLRGRRIAYVAQSAAASFNPAHRLIDQFCEAPLKHDVMARPEAMSYANSLYERMNLPDPGGFGFRYPHEVSGGQLQRAMTAMALSCRPDLIIFDEPTTALDVTTQIEVLAAIRDIVKQFNTAAIYISHDLAVVAQMADTIKVLLKGDEVEQATTSKMLKSPKEDYTKSLWAVREYARAEQPLVTAEQPVIEIKNVTAGYSPREDILNNVSFVIHRRRTVAVVGESGSGKSTTARVITGLLKPRLGSVKFSGTPLPASYQDRSRDQLRHVQMIYQMADTALNPRQRIREVIGRPLSFYLGMTGKQREDRTRELLTMIELNPDEYIDRYPTELSGGQKQRIAIARAILKKSKIILLDEATSSLDAETENKIQDAINFLTKGRTTLVIAHRLSTILNSDKIYVIDSGEVIGEGKHEDLLKNSEIYKNFYEKQIQKH